MPVGVPLCSRYRVPACGLDGISLVRAFPGYALHEKGLQRQKGVGTFVSIQERREHFAPPIKRGCTARQPLTVFPHRFK